MNRKRWICAAALAFLWGCGHKAPPLIPKPRVPAAPADLSVTVECGALLLSFGVPEFNANGEPLTDLDGFVLERKRGPRPDPRQAGKSVPGEAETPTPTPTPTPGAPEEPPPGPAWIPEADFVRIAKVEFVPTPRPTPPAEEDSQERPAGARSRRIKPVLLEYRDTGGYTEEFTGEVPPGLLDGYGYSYRVAGVNRRGRIGLFSPVLTLIYETQPAPPRGIEAEVEEGVVLLRWTPVEEDCHGGELPLLEGYRVYRSTEAGDAPPVSLNAKPVEEPTYRDDGVVMDQTYHYTVRAVRKGGRTLSDPSAELRVVTEDRFAPGSPSGLLAVPSTLGVNLVWNASAASDLAGYHVYRRDQAERRWQRLTQAPVEGTSYLDPSARRGARYTYAVTAVDDAAAANESEPSSPVTVRIGR